MQKYRTFLTKKGREKIVAVEAAGTHLALRHVAVGDALDPPTEDLTKLRNEVWRGEVNRIQVDAKDAHVLNVEAVIPAQDGGFMVRELGLFDTEGDLIAVGRAPDSYKPLVEDGAAKSLLIVFKIIIDNTAVVALSVDDSVVLVTREYLAQQLSLHTTNKDNPHGVTKSQVGLGNVQNYGLATQTEAEAGTSNAKYMTPKATSDAISKQGNGQVIYDNTIKADTPWSVFPSGVNVYTVVESGEVNENDWRRLLGITSTSFVQITVTVTKQSASSYRGHQLIVGGFNFNSGTNTINKVAIRKFEASDQKPITNFFLMSNGGDLTGILKAHNNTSYSMPQTRNIIMSTDEPTDESAWGNGDLWVVYE